LFENYVKIRSNVKEPVLDKVFYKILTKSVDRIDELALFREVSVMLNRREIANLPACMVLPKKLSLAERHLSGGRNDYRFAVDIAFGLKNFDDTSTIQYILSYAEAIRGKFNHGDNGANLLAFPEAEGHYNTEVEDVSIEPVLELSDGVFLYSSGINLVFYVTKIN
jgi:hypothetical protein